MAAGVIGDGRPDGNTFGASTTEKVSLYGVTPVVQPSALTAQLTTITIADAAGVPDYALSALTTTAPYGLATAAEAITLLYVIKNLQTRMAELETAVEALGIVAAN